MMTSRRVDGRRFVHFTSFSDERESCDEDDTEATTGCGLGACRPSWLQKFATIQSFVGFYAVANIFTFSNRMYLVSQLSTIEKRFGLSSAQSGVILSSSQATFVLCILFFSHYSQHSHIPRILSVTSMIAGATSLLFATAHFIPQNDGASHRSAFSSNVNSSDSHLPSDHSVRFTCLPINGSYKMEEPICDEVSGASGNYIALGIFLTAMLIQGAVTAPRAPLSGTFIDDNNPVPMNSGKYIGILMGVLTFSTVVSFGSGAISSCIFHTLEETSLTPGDPQWIGAWWLGFLVLGTLSIVFSFLILFFPKRLKVASLKSTPAREVKVSNEIGGHTSFNQILSGFVEPLKCVFRILRIPVFTLVVLTITMHTFAILGMVSFFPKYLETQFYRPAYQASIMVGVISLVGGSLGPVVGGFVTSHFQLTNRGNLRLILTVCILLTASCPIGMLLAGHPPELVKTDFSGHNEQLGSTQTQKCVSGCTCASDVMEPVCGSDGVTYYSPCHAGCTSGNHGSYWNCSCTLGTAASGLCQQEDPTVYPFLVYATTVSFLSMFSTSASFMIIVRSVREEEKSLALGLSSFISTLLGHFPAPFVYGMIVDSTCSIWQNSCSGGGACAIYSLTDFRLKMFGTNMIFFFTSALLISVAILLRKSPSQETGFTKTVLKKTSGEPVSVYAVWIETSV